MMLEMVGVISPLGSLRVVWFRYLLRGVVVEIDSCRLHVGLSQFKLMRVIWGL